MTTEEKASEIVMNIQNSGSLDYDSRRVDYMYDAAMEMAKWKDSQPQIIEIFGKRVKIVEDESHTVAFCHDCVFHYFCKYVLGRIGELCETADHELNRHFVEVDENGDEIEKQQE